MAGDLQLTCSDCGQEFTFTSEDQAFFQERGYSAPKRCKPCRQAKKNEQGGGGGWRIPASRVQRNRSGLLRMRAADDRALSSRVAIARCIAAIATTRKRAAARVRDAAQAVAADAGATKRRKICPNTSGYEGR